MKKRYLVQNLEQILDENTGRTIDVLIHQSNLDSTSTAFLSGYVDAAANRRFATSPDSVLPARRERIERRTSSYAKQKLRDRSSSMLSQVALKGSTKGLRREHIERIRTSNSERLQRLVRSDSMQPTLSRLEDGSNGIGEKSVYINWAAASIGVKILRSELERIRDMENDADAVSMDVSVNRKVPGPSYSEADVDISADTKIGASVWGVDKVNALAAWGAYDARGKGVRIAVLDTGVDVSHPDLARFDGSSKIKKAVAFDENGFLVPGDEGEDVDGHGTHVCGTIAGGNSAGGKWIGVAPDCELYSARVLGKNGGTFKQIIAGIQWAIENEVDVINLSLGGLDFDHRPGAFYTNTIVTALLAGIPVVAAIGNNGHQTSGAPGNDFFAFSIGATDHRDRAAAFSGGNAHLLESSPFIPASELPFPYITPRVSAPGVDVVSAKRGGGHIALSGTSMATPHVSGAIASLLAASSLRDALGGGELASAIQDFITGSVVELGEQGQDQRFGFGRIDVLAAIAYARALGFG